MIAPVRLVDFLENLYVPGHLGMAAETIRQHELALRLWERHAGRPLTLDDFDEVAVRQFLAAYLSTGVSPSTVNAKRRNLVAQWNWAYQEGLVERPPRTARIPRLREPYRPPEAWTPEEIGRLLWTAERLFSAERHRWWWHPGILFLYDTACRISEMLRLERRDFDLDKGLAVLADMKTGKYRLGRLHPDTVAAIRQHCPRRGRPLAWPLSRKWLDILMRRLCDVAGLRYGRDAGGLWHKLRRSSGTAVEQNGGDGARHLGNTRTVFERHYLDPRLVPDTLQYLPRPKFPQ